MCCHINTQLASLTTSSSFSLEVPIHRGWRVVRRLPGEQYESSVRLHLHLLTKQPGESNILPSPVSSTVFALPPYSPPAHIFHPSLTPSLMEPRSIRHETLVNLSKSDAFPRDGKKKKPEPWWSPLRGEGGDGERKGRGGRDKDYINTQKTL